MKKEDPQFNYIFGHPELETLALTHPSCALETGDNQRLEFLGDAVLDLVVAEKLYRKFSDADEGALDSARAAIVNGKSLAVAAQQIGLSERLRVGESQRRHQPEPSDAMLEDCLEALIGAIYLDGGLETARGFIDSALGQQIEATVPDAARRNAKSLLQEWTQSRHEGAIPEYDVIHAEGPDHRRRYVVGVALNGRDLGCGEGSSIKQAERAAAEAALARLEEDA